MEYEFMTGNAPMNEGVVTKNGVRIEVINAVVTIKQEVLIKDEQGKKEEVGDFGGSPKAKLSDGQSTADSTMLGWSSNEGDDLSSCGRQDCETGPSSELKSCQRENQKTFTCDKCDYKSVQLRNLKRHIKTHCEGKPYICDKCEYRASQLGYLKKHMKFHSGNKPYSCDSCNFKTVQQGDLKRHMRTHTGEKRYSCDICPYKCAEPGDIRIHIRTHTGEKPYACNICDYRASKPGDVKKTLESAYWRKAVRM